MNIRVLLFAGLRERAGKSELTLDVPTGTRLVDLVSHVCGDGPTTEKIARGLLFAVNKEYAARETVVKDGDEVALIPPVAGG